MIYLPETVSNNDQAKLPSSQPICVMNVGAPKLMDAHLHSSNRLYSRKPDMPGPGTLDLAQRDQFQLHAKPSRIEQGIRMAI